MKKHHQKPKKQKRHKPTFTAGSPEEPVHWATAKHLEKQTQSQLTAGKP